MHILQTLNSLLMSFYFIFSQTFHPTHLKKIIKPWIFMLEEYHTKDVFCVKYSTITWMFSVCIRLRHPAGHHGESGTEQLAGQRYLRGKLQWRQLPETAGGSGPAAGEEVCHRPGGWEASEHAGTGDAATKISIYLLFTRPAWLGHSSIPLLGLWEHQFEKMSLFSDCFNHEVLNKGDQNMKDFAWLFQ